VSTGQINKNIVSFYFQQSSGSDWVESSTSRQEFFWGPVGPTAFERAQHSSAIYPQRQQQQQQHSFNGETK
jgi:hypothetical protein